MHVSIETTTGLERRMTVELPEERVTQALQIRLRKLARTVRLDGFRVGKVPFTVVEKKFGKQVLGEVLGDLMQQSFEEAVEQNSLRPAGGPRIEARTASEGQGLAYSATFEVYPEIAWGSFSALKVAQPDASITEEDIDAMLETLRKQRRSWNQVERGAIQGDQLQVTFTTRIDGGEPQGDPDKEHAFIVGSNAPEFDQQLLGAEAGQTITVNYSFPADYQSPDLAGKPVEYTLQVISVSEPVLPALDEDFVRSFGVEDGTLEALRREARNNMQRELDQAIRTQTKQQLMDAMLAAYPIEIPKALLEREIDHLQAQARNQVGVQGRGAHAAERPRDEYAAAARRRVTLGLLFSEVALRENIKPEPGRVRGLVEGIAATYQKPDEVVNWYYQNPDELARIESLALEDQVVDWLLAQVDASRVPTTFSALLNPGSVQTIKG
ncbi:MAG: trigger factor [Gammaproteobacteria bacterium]|nr:trigger factor [Gammaproteobacteria bacterium]